MTAGLAATLAERGHGVRVVTDSGSADSLEQDGPVGIDRLPLHHALSSRDPDVIAGLVERVGEIDGAFSPDVVNLHAMHPGWYFHLRTRRRDSPPSVFTSHGWSGYPTGPGSLTGRVLRSASRIVCCREFVAATGRRLVPDVADRFITNLNGVMPSGLTTGPANFDPPHLVYASRLVSEKGITDLLRVLPGVIAEVPSLHVTVAGSGSLEAEVRAMVAADPLLTAVSVTGAVDPAVVQNLMAAATVVVVPSREGVPAETSEPFGLVAAEAAVLGRPVVATSVGGLPEIVVHGGNGLLVAPGDIGGLADSIRTILADPAAAIRMGETGRRYAARNFDWHAHVDRYEKLYDEIMESGR
jgi:glycogen(starch) synthase